jgi:hypothetical protein
MGRLVQVGFILQGTAWVPFLPRAASRLKASPEEDGATAVSQGPRGGHLGHAEAEQADGTGTQGFAASWCEAFVHGHPPERPPR